MKNYVVRVSKQELRYSIEASKTSEKLQILAKHKKYLEFEGSSPDEYLEVPFFLICDVALIKDKPIFTITERSTNTKL